MSTQELGSLERKVLQYRGGVIRSLSRDILESQGQNAILAGIITLLLADVSPACRFNQFSPHEYIF